MKQKANSIGVLNSLVPKQKSQESEIRVIVVSHYMKRGLFGLTWNKFDDAQEKTNLKLEKITVKRGDGRDQIKRFRSSLNEKRSYVYAHSHKDGMKKCTIYLKKNMETIPFALT